MVTIEVIFAAVGNFLTNVCAGVVGNLITEPLFRRFPARAASPPDARAASPHDARAASPPEIEERDLHDEPYVETFSVVSRIISEIIFRRQIFGADSFRDSHSAALNLTTKILDVRSVAAQNIMLALDKGAFIAFQRGKLDAMAIVLCMGVDEPMEKFTFKFKYGQTTADTLTYPKMNMSLGNSLGSLIRALNDYLQEHPTKKKAPWTVLLELSISEMEESIPFFRRRDCEMATSGVEQPIGRTQDTTVTFTLTVETCAPSGKQKCVDNNEQSASSSSACEIFVAKIDASETIVPLPDL